MNWKEQKAMQQASVHKDCLKRLREVGCGGWEVRKMDSFLSHFCCTTQIYLTDFFVRAQMYKHKRNLANTHQECLKRLEKVGYGEPEVCKMDSFLGPFSWVAQIYLTNLFVRARIHKKHFWTVLSICEVYRHAVWSESSPERYGDPDDGSVDSLGRTRGARNAGAMARVYLALNLPFTGLH